MKKFKTIIGILLASSILLLSACGKGASSGSGTQTGNNEEKGRYVETNITPAEIEEGSIHLYEKTNGDLVAFNEGFSKRFDSNNSGDSWTSSDGPGKTSHELGMVHSAAYDEDKDSILTISIRDGVNKLYYYTMDGTATPIDFAEIDEAVANGNEVYANTIKLLPQNRLYINFFGYPPFDENSTVSAGEDVPEDAPEDAPEDKDNSDTENDDNEKPFSMGGHVAGSYLYDLGTQKIVANLEEYQPYSVAYDDKNLYISSYYNDSVEIISLDTGTASSENAPKADMPNDNNDLATLAIGKKQNLLTMRKKGLYTTENNETKEIFSNEYYSLSAPNGQTQNIIQADDNTYIINYSIGIQGNLLKYSWDENASLNPENILRVWTLEENPAARAAIAELRKKKPDVNVLLEVALAEENMTAEDAIKNLNTLLIAGEGPDVLILDGIPAETYAKKGMLANLNGIVDISSMREPLRDIGKDGDALYFLPTRMLLPILLGNSESLGKVTNLESFVNEIKNGPNYRPFDGSSSVSELAVDERAFSSFGTWNELYDFLVSSASGEIVKNNQIDKEQLKSFLSALKTITEKYELKDPKEVDTGGSMTMASVGIGGSMLDVPESLMLQGMGRANTAAFLANDMILLEMYANDKNTSMKLLSILAENPWIPNNIVAISADSQKQELAAEFIKTLLSDEVQSASGVLGIGFPVTASGLELMYKYIKENFQFSMGNGRVEKNDNIGENPYEALISSASTAVYKNKIISEKMQDAAYAYSTGKLDLEGAMSQIEQNTRNYLAERG